MMHPIVEQIENLFLSDLERVASQMRERFPSLVFNVWRWPVGTLTDYKGYDLGVECILPVRQNASDNVALMIELCHLDSKPRLMADVVWGHPSGHSEAAFRDNCLTDAEWPEVNQETIQGLRECFATLIRAFEEAVSLGAPSV